MTGDMFDFLEDAGKALRLASYTLAETEPETVSLKIFGSGLYYIVMFDGKRVGRFFFGKTEWQYVAETAGRNIIFTGIYKISDMLTQIGCIIREEDVN